MKEKDLHEKVRKWIFESYPGSFVYKSNDRSTAGIPDILACCNGIMVGIEIKLNHKLSPLQAAVLKKINRAGGMGLVWKKDQVELVDHFSIKKQEFTCGPCSYKDFSLKQHMENYR
jgi:hypothetical protein